MKCEQVRHSGRSIIRKVTCALPLLMAVACGSSKPAEGGTETAQSSGNETPSDGTGGGCSLRGAPTTAEECTCAGGVVHGDIGDGKVACGEGETELGRIQQGIEGAVCCGPASAVL